MLLCEEDPKHRGLKLRRTLQVGDAVMTERPGDSLLEHLRQTGTVDIKVLQVNVEILTGAMDVATAVIVCRPIVAQLREIDKSVDQVKFFGQRSMAFRVKLPSR